MTPIIQRAIYRLIQKAAHIWLCNRSGDTFSLQLTQDDLAAGEMAGKQIQVEFRFINAEKETTS